MACRDGWFGLPLSSRCRRGEPQPRGLGLLPRRRLPKRLDFGRLACYRSASRAAGEALQFGVTGMAREWHSEPGIDRAGELIATIFLLVMLGFFLYGIVPRFL